MATSVLPLSLNNRQGDCYRRTNNKTSDKIINEHKINMNNNNNNNNNNDNNSDNNNDNDNNNSNNNNNDNNNGNSK